VAGSAGEIATLVVDDTLLYRLMVTEALDRIEGFRVVGKADNGIAGLEAVRRLSPQLVLLDLEMPEMDGFEMLSVLRREHPDIKVMIISALSKQGGRVTLDALQNGAFDFITKPQEKDAKASREVLFEQLKTKLEPLRRNTAQRSGPATTSAPSRVPVAERMYGTADPQAPKSRGASAPASSVSAACDAVARQRVEVIGIGVSTGGPQALGTLLGQLTPDLPPICIVQHMPGPFLTAMAEKLDAQCALRIVEGRDGDPLQRNTVYIAPGGSQMGVSRSGLQVRISLRDAPAENHCLPAADYLLRSLAEAFGKKALGVVLTGMGNDGAKGLLQLREAGALTLVQDEASCTVYGMPKQAARLGAAAYELPLNDIARVFGSAG
jgi:two-component system chemotaxis response regulator CheB